MAKLLGLMEEGIQLFESNGSGLRVNSFLKVCIDVANYELINEGGYIDIWTGLCKSIRS